ncbi:uncharacterized protein LOC133412530 isoform X1 [Phycodurus eques]|uniref:uncharacterized protein LOC133412530 isoform X1 n=1 Tax=Phycodurus eques TaxID=693459 RepID=UPI002ACD2F13|nr:uncharacterized protein LOC133412530 isoform X1 [Phycodurus eques]
MSVRAAAGCWTLRRWRCLRTRQSVTAAASRRQCSKLATKQENTSPKRSKFRPAPSATHDWIGPPDPLSNLRPVVYRVARHESELERRLRNLRQDTEDWNHRFWTQQNVTFSKEKEAFIVSQLKAKGLTERDQQGCPNLQHTRATGNQQIVVNGKRRHSRPEFFAKRTLCSLSCPASHPLNPNGHPPSGIIISLCRHKVFLAEPIWTLLPTKTAAAVEARNWNLAVCCKLLLKVLSYAATLALTTIGVQVAWDTQHCGATTAVYWNGDMDAKKHCGATTSVYCTGLCFNRL